MGTFETGHEREIRELKLAHETAIAIQRSASKSVVASLQADNKALKEWAKDAHRKDCYSLKSYTFRDNPKCDCKPKEPPTKEPK